MINAAEPDEAVITPLWRLLLFVKALFLIALAALFAALLVWWFGGPVGFVQLLAAPFLVLFAGFLCWAASLGLRDVVTGRARIESGTVRLLSRRSGYSARLESGRVVEFILFNPWEPLRDGERYVITYGVRSGVIVAEPKSQS